MQVLVSMPVSDCLVPNLIDIGAKILLVCVCACTHVHFNSYPHYLNHVFLIVCSTDASADDSAKRKRSESESFHCYLAFIWRWLGLYVDFFLNA